MNKINQLLKDIQRSNFEGLGKPEPLKHFNGYWSRRIDDKNRLVYAIDEQKNIILISCKGHYED